MAKSATSSRQPGRIRQSDLREGKSFPLESQVTAALDSVSADNFLTEWATRYKLTGNDYERSRSLAFGHSYAQGILSMKQDFFNAGFRLGGADEVIKEKGADFVNRVARDTWTEFLACDNAVAMWMKPRGRKELPVVTILNCEQVEYRNTYGVQVLKVKVAPNLTPEQKAKLPQRYVDAAKKGGWLEIKEEEDEFFRVLTRAKLGHGLSGPRMKAVFDDLAIWDLLRIGDWNGASARRNIIRHVKKGHEISGGNNGGASTHFLKSKFAKALRKHLSTLMGSADLISNFDLTMDHVFLKSEFFDPKVHAATQGRLDQWAGPVAMMLRGSEGNGAPSPWLMEMFEAEARGARALVKDFLESIFTHPTFRLKEVKVTFDDSIFLSHKFRQTWVQQAYANGLMSGETARDWLRLDNVEESRRMLASHANPKEFTPPFEAKQGMGLAQPVNEGGRPTKEEK